MLISLKKIKFGFTLAEILITLGIIGVVAAMTIPTLMANYREKQTITKMKKFMATFSQAIKLAKEENGDIAGWADSYEGTDVISIRKGFYDKLKPHLKLAKDCGNKSNCISDKGTVAKYNEGDGTTTNADFNTNERFVKGILLDGSTFIIEITGTDCSNDYGTSQDLKNVCGALSYDVNGVDVGPNEMGKDFFYFWITENGLIPRGTKMDTNAPIETTCTPDGKKYGCAAWVIYRENMDYLKRQVSW